MPGHVLPALPLSCPVKRLSFLRRHVESDPATLRCRFNEKTLGRIADIGEDNAVKTALPQHRCLLQRKCMISAVACRHQLARHRINIDYFPTNFVVQDGLIHYIDFECNDYMDEWNFENWGVKYWSKTPDYY